MKINLFSNLKKYLACVFTNKYYQVLNVLPHQRVCTPKQDIFDLFKLGIFNHSECLELVALQPQATYQLHYHQQSQATIFIIQGVGFLRLGQQFLAYQGGEKIHIPAMVAHGFITHSKTLFLSIQTPPILKANGDVDLHEVESAYV